METMPEEVKQVHEAMVANADKAFENKDHRAVYTRLRDGAWIIGSNYEGMSTVDLVYRDGVWKYRICVDADDGSYDEHGEKPMPHGFDEAMSNARIFFTG